MNSRDIGRIGKTSRAELKPGEWIDESNNSKIESEGADQVDDQAEIADD